MAATSVGVDLGSAAELAHVPQDSRSGEDPRYADLLRGATPVQALRKVFGLQGLLTLFVSFPMQLSAVTGPTPKPLLAVGGVGLAVWLVGITFEAVGDWQL